MPSLYLYITDTLADWEPAHVLAELHSGRYLKDPDLRYEVVLCGRTLNPVTTMGGLPMKPDILFNEIRPGAGDVVVLPGADTWLDPVQMPVIAKIRTLLEAGTLVAAICGATLGLANAGLLDNRVTNIISKVPGLGDIPVLGMLFKSKNLQKNKTELMVLVTARRVSPNMQPPPLPKFPYPFMNDTPARPVGK